MKVCLVSEEKIKGKAEIVAYVKFSNQEIHRLLKNRIQKYAPDLLIQYYESLVKFVGDKPNEFEKTNGDEKIEVSLKRARLDDNIENHMKTPKKTPCLAGLI